MHEMERDDGKCDGYSWREQDRRENRKVTGRRCLMLHKPKSTERPLCVQPNWVLLEKGHMPI